MRKIAAFASPFPSPSHPARHLTQVSLVCALALGGCVFEVGPDALRAERDGLPPGAASSAPGAPTRIDDGAAPGDPGDPGDPDAPDVVAPAPQAPLPPWDASRTFTALRDGRIVGDIGPARGVDLPTDIERVYDDGYYTQIDVFALRSDGRRVMLQLQVDNFGQGAFFVPGVGKRLRPGYTSAGYVAALACEGPDSGDAMQPFGDTPFDEEPCEVSVDTEQDPADPENALLVTVQAVFADANGDCPAAPGAGDVGDGDFCEEELPDLDGDGDGDLPPCPADPADPADPEGPGAGSGSDDGAVNPLATTTFTLAR